MAIAVAALVLSTTACTVTLGDRDHATKLSTPVSGPSEHAPLSSGPALAYDDHPARGR